jgi:hypothetical protein
MCSRQNKPDEFDWFFKWVLCISIVSTIVTLGSIITVLYLIAFYLGAV